MRRRLQRIAIGAGKVLELGIDIGARQRQAGVALHIGCVRLDALGAGARVRQHQNADQLRVIKHLRLIVLIIGIEGGKVQRQMAIQQGGFQAHLIAVDMLLLGRRGKAEVGSIGRHCWRGQSGGLRFRESMRGVEGVGLVTARIGRIGHHALAGVILQRNVADQRGRAVFGIPRKTARAKGAAAVKAVGGIEILGKVPADLVPIVAQAGGQAQLVGELLGHMSIDRIVFGGRDIGLRRGETNELAQAIAIDGGVGIEGAQEVAQRLAGIGRKLEFLRHLPDIAVVALQVVERRGVATGQEVEEIDIGFKQILRLELLFVEIGGGRGQGETTQPVIGHHAAIGVLIARAHIDRRGIAGVAIFDRITGEHQRRGQRWRTQQKRARRQVLIDEILAMRLRQRVMAHRGHVKIGARRPFQLAPHAIAVGLRLFAAIEVVHRIGHMAVIARQRIAQRIADRTGGVHIHAVFAIIGEAAGNAELLRIRGGIGDKVDDARRSRAPAIHLDRHTRGEADRAFVGVGRDTADTIGHAAVESTLDFHRGHHAVDVRQVGDMLLGNGGSAQHGGGDGDIPQLFGALLRGDNDFGGIFLVGLLGLRGAGHQRHQRNRKKCATARYLAHKSSP